MARAASSAHAIAALPLQSWDALALELRAIEETLERLAGSTTLLPGHSRSAPVAAAKAYRRLSRNVLRERLSAELLAEPHDLVTRRTA